jgi:hypothetical protein
MNERYHKKIADILLANQLKMIKNIPNPTMFDNELKALSDLHDDVIYGGVRPTKYIQSGNNVASFDPSSLSTAREISDDMPHLVESGGRLRKSGRARKAGGNLFDDIGNFAKTVAPIAKAAAPYAIPLMMAAGMEKKKRGRPKKIVQAPSILTNKEIVQQMPKGSGMRKKKPSGGSTSGGDFLSTLKSIGNYIKPVAETVGKEVILPVATEVGRNALKSYLTSGAGLSGGRAKRSNPRALLVKKVMKDKGLSMIESSKYIKQNNLY